MVAQGSKSRKVRGSKKLKEATVQSTPPSAASANICSGAHLAFHIRQDYLNIFSKFK